MSEYVQVASSAGSLFLPAATVVCSPVDTDRLADHGRLNLTGEEINGMGDDDTVEAVAAARRLRARADALEARALARLDQRRGESRYTPDEAALELRTSRQQAQARLARARELTCRWPHLLAAMRRGEIEAYPASRIADVATGLADGIAREVDARLAEKLAAGVLSWVDPSKLVRAARRLANQLDPDCQATKATRARRERGVFLFPGEDTMSTLSGYLPAEVTAAAYTRVDTLARALRNTGDQRNLDQLRADVYADLLLGRRPTTGADSGAVGAAVHLHAPIDAALSMSDAGAELSGYGPIPGPIAREIMYQPDSVWRAVLTDPRTGVVKDLGRRRYRPTQAMRDLIRARDRECTHCSRPARYCDVDHQQPWSEGGVTAVDNLPLRCEHSHYLRDHPDWELGYHPHTGVASITTPAGRTHHRPHQPIIDPGHDPPNRFFATRHGDDDIGESPLILPNTS